MVRYLLIVTLFAATGCGESLLSFPQVPVTLLDAGGSDVGVADSGVPSADDVGSDVVVDVADAGIDVVADAGTDVVVADTRAGVTDVDTEDTRPDIGEDADVFGDDVNRLTCGSALMQHDGFLDMGNGALTSDSGSNFTFEVWAVANRAGSDERDITLASMSNPTRAWSLYLQVSGELCLRVESPSMETVWCGPPRTPELEWSHYAMTVVGRRVALWVHGDKVADEMLDPALAGVANEWSMLTIGSRRTLDAEYVDGFDGYLAQARLSDERRYATPFTPERGWTPDAHTVGQWTLSSNADDSVGTFDGYLSEGWWTSACPQP